MELIISSQIFKERTFTPESYTVSGSFYERILDGPIDAMHLAIHYTEGIQYCKSLMFSRPETPSTSIKQTFRCYGQENRSHRDAAGSPILCEDFNHMAAGIEIHGEGNRFVPRAVPRSD